VGWSFIFKLFCLKARWVSCNWCEQPTRLAAAVA